MPNCLAAIALACPLVLSAHAAVAQQPPSPETAESAPLTLGAAVDLAATQAPQLTARSLEVQASRAAAIPAAALPDPKLFVGVENYPVTGPRAMEPAGSEMTMYTVGVMQEIPSPAKRRARAARAEADVGLATANLALEHHQVRTYAALAWIDLYFLGRRLAALESLEREIRLLEETAPARIESGSAPIAEATAPPLAAAALANRRTELRAQAERARAELARWIGAAARQPLAGAAHVGAPDTARLRAELDRHPVLRAYDPAIARAEAEVREARAAKRPDWAVQAAFHGRDPDYGQMVSAMVTVDLPLFAGRRQEPLIQAATLRASRLRTEREAARRELAADLDKALADYAAAAEELQRTRETILPLARQKVELQTASYRAQQVPFDMVLEARREQVEAELKLVDLESQSAKAAARLAYYFRGSQ